MTHSLLIEPGIAFRMLRDLPLGPLSIDPKKSLKPSLHVQRWN